MSDSGEGLVDASTRLAERMEEVEESRRMTSRPGPRVDPERVRVLESLRLARTDLERQLGVMTHQRRRQQLAEAIAEIERRLGALGMPA